MKTNEIMKKIALFLLALMAVASITSCNKAEDNALQAGSADLSFDILPGLAPGGLKDAPTCINESKTASYVEVTLLKQGEAASSTKTLTVFYIDGKPHTNTIKLAPGTYAIKEFLMKNDNMTPNNPGDDPIIAAAVHSTASYASLVNTPLDQTITIEGFKKNVMSLELVCYEEAHYNDFGFEYFNLEQTAIREQYFFGDFCIKNLDDYKNSPYSAALGGNANLLLDLPAIYQIEVYRNGSLTGTFNNNSTLGIAQPLKIQYADPSGTTDHFEFKLSIMVRQGTAFNYVYFHSWTFDDGAKIPSGTDGIVEFVLGNCLPDADLVIPPWMNLPQTCTYTIGNWRGGSSAPTMGGYVDANLGGFPINTFDFNPGVYASWCADHNVNISVGQHYTMDVYSSLYPEKLPVWAQHAKWGKMNWIMNHLDWYPGYTWEDIQGAMWRFENVAVTGIGLQMYNDAQTYGPNYKVPSGGWACIIFIDHDTPAGAVNPKTQTMFIKVDP